MNEPNDSRDTLALVRTDLANERTLLAYGRTALMVAGTGVSLIEFFDRSEFLVGLGWLFTVTGGVIGIVGLIRFTQLHGRLHKHQQPQD